MSPPGADRPGLRRAHGDDPASCRSSLSINHSTCVTFAHNLPRRIFSMTNLLPAVLVGGPPHAGKSVLFYQLTQALRERGIAHFAIRACPDGEGDWFHEG